MNLSELIPSTTALVSNVNKAGTATKFKPMAAKAFYASLKEKSPAISNSECKREYNLYLRTCEDSDTGKLVAYLSQGKIKAKTWTHKAKNNRLLVEFGERTKSSVEDIESIANDLDESDLDETIAKLTAKKQALLTAQNTITV